MSEPIRFTCPACGAPLTVPFEDAGTYGKCPACDQPIKVPGVYVPPLPPPPPAEPAPIPAPIPAAAAAPALAHAPSADQILLIVLKVLGALVLVAVIFGSCGTLLIGCNEIAQNSARGF